MIRSFVCTLFLSLCFVFDIFFCTAITNSLELFCVKAATNTQSKRPNKALTIERAQNILMLIIKPCLSVRQLC